MSLMSPVLPVDKIGIDLDQPLDWYKAWFGIENIGLVRLSNDKTLMSLQNFTKYILEALSFVHQKPKFLDQNS